MHLYKILIYVQGSDLMKLLLSTLLLTGSLLGLSILLPATAIAQTGMGASYTGQVEAASDRAFLQKLVTQPASWSWLGLLGLAGLIGRQRSANQPVAQQEYREEELAGRY